MTQDEPVLFWTTEPRFGCSQPVRSGDLLRVKWDTPKISIGSPFLVLGASKDNLRFNSGHELWPESAFGIAGGDPCWVPVDWLEVIVETR